ncbi:MAG: hypothetical protein JW863_22880 [Chitinispirillaceae bacterium]|nr:hypothetical protein [Chitinispirillaceae bacterium]
MNSPDPFKLFINSLSSTESFTDNARKTATFIRANEERCEVPILFKSMLNAAKLPQQRERLLFSLLDISRADFDIVTQALRLRHLRRLFNKTMFFQEALSDKEKELYAHLGTSAGITTIDQVVSLGRLASTWMRLIADGETVGERERELFAILLTSESELLKNRTVWLSENVDAYDMRAIARMMPLLTVCDEQCSVLEEIAGRLVKGGRLGRAILTIEYAMKSDGFEKWLKKAGTEPSLHPYLKLIGAQRSKRIPTIPLIAVSTLSRLLHAPGTPELTWITHAHSACTSDGFKMETGTSINQVRSRLAGTTVSINGTVLYGTFSDSALTALVSTDMLPIHFEDAATEPTPKELISQCINKDALLMRLLDNPKISGTPGIVAYVATTSRSLAVLQKIATSRELYTGQANRNVPLALLKNPAHLPLLHLRQFINAKYVSLIEMKGILHNPYGIRREIHEEIRRFVEMRYR